MPQCMCMLGNKKRCGRYATKKFFPYCTEKHKNSSNNPSNNDQDIGTENNSPSKRDNFLKKLFPFIFPFIYNYKGYILCLICDLSIKVLDYVYYNYYHCYYENNFSNDTDTIHEESTFNNTYNSTVYEDIDYADGNIIVSAIHGYTGFFISAILCISDFVHDLRNTYTYHN